MIKQSSKWNKTLTPTATYHTKQFGDHDAKIPVILGLLEDDAVPLLHIIVTQDLACEEIVEVSSEGDVGWEFTYQGR